MKRKRKVIGLTQHVGTEPLAASTTTVFREIESALDEEFQVKRLPFYWQALGGEELASLAGRFMSECDAVFDAPGDARFLQVRQSLDLSTPLVWFDLGAMARGALQLRRGYHYFSSRDSILFSCTADRSIYNLFFAESCARRSVVPFCVDDSFRTFHNASERQQVDAMRRHLRIANDTVVFLYTGRLMREKNVHATLLAFEQVIARFPNALLLLVGYFYDQQQYSFGAAEQDFQILCRQLLAGRSALAQRCRFYDAVNRSELPLVYNLADVFVNLTLHGDENFGLSQVEAMACGLPIVATVWGGLQDTVRHGVNGFLVDTRINEWGVRADLHQAVEYCLALASSAELRRNLGRRGSALAKAEYGRELFARRIRDELRRMVSRPQAPRGAVRRTRLSRFGARYQREFSDSSGQPQLPLYTNESYWLYRRLIRPYTAGTARQAGARVALAPLAFRIDSQGFENIDPLWSRTFSADAHELPLLQRLHELATAGQRLFDVPVLLDGLERGPARQALRTLTRKGLLIGTPPRLDDMSSGRAAAALQDASL